jgi:simple sugar transport system ATP-binding protein
MDQGLDGATGNDAVGTPVLTVSGLSKTYGATRALRGVDLELRAGEVVGLIGTNGAGKSTLIKILSGVAAPTSGEVTLDGRVVHLRDPLAAQSAGIATVHQEINAGVVFGASVAENLTLDRVARSSIFTTRKQVRRAAAEVADAFGLDVDLDAPIEDLAPPQRQNVILARVLARRPRVLILDEPTSSLSADDAEQLVATVRRLAAMGVAVLYVSHRLAEIRELCDRVAVLRDGAVAARFDAPVTGPELVAAMLGDQVAALEHPVAAPVGEPILTALGIRAVPDADPFDVNVYAGQVLGITGLVGAGKTELLEQLFGARPLISGSVTLYGKPYEPKDPADAINAGVALVSEERASQAIVPEWSVRDHVALPRLRRHSTSGLISRRSETTAALDTISRFAVRAPGPGAAIETLSGGNQQKVLVGRWLDGRSRLVLLDEPFRGVDIGARGDIAARLRESSSEVGVILASSDPEEILQVADRVLVLHEGRFVGELTTAEASADRLAALMSGESA